MMGPCKPPEVRTPSGTLGRAGAGAEGQLLPYFMSLRMEPAANNIEVNDREGIGPDSEGIPQTKQPFHECSCPVLHIATYGISTTIKSNSVI